jgi:OOP family OmpA-OmpF porin
MIKETCIAIALIALAGCDRDRDSAPPPAASNTPAAAESAKVSIIRPDIEVAQEPEPPLTPITVQIGFEKGGADLSEGAVAALEKVLATKQMAQGGGITLGGHSDSAGSDSANLRESVRRAEAVRDWLIEHGVAEDRIALVGYGEQNPVAPNASPDGQPNPAGRARNRRVELTVAVPAGTPAAAQSSEAGTLVDELTAQE